MNNSFSLSKSHLLQVLLPLGVALAWIWLHYGFKLLDGLALLIGTAVVVYGIYRIVKVVNCADMDTSFMRQCRDKLKTGTSGCVTEPEYYATTTKIMELIDKHMQEKK